MSQPYSNLPSIVDQTDSTVQAFNAYFTQPVELNSATLAAMTAFFTSRQFGQISAQSIATTIMMQAKKDGYNPLKILDTLKGLNDLELSALVSEILNYNRFKTSSLGTAQTFVPNSEIYRNVVDTPSLPKLYSVVPSATTIYEGDSITFTINTVNVPNGTTLYWTLSGIGITGSDFNDGKTSGSVVINGNMASVTISIKRDTQFESNEILVFNLRKKSIYGSIVASGSVVLKNTDFSFMADWIVFDYIGTPVDFDSRTRVVLPSTGDYVSGGIRGDRLESLLLNLSSIRTNGVENIIIDCRGQWFSYGRAGLVDLRVRMYNGGTMSSNRNNDLGWVNNGGTSGPQLTVSKTISLVSQDPNSIGERIATFKYNLVTGQGYLDLKDTTDYPYT
jgi:hypothetical protein